MQITSLSELKAHLSEYADRAAREHERYVVTKNGRPSVVLVSAEEWEAMEDTVFWQAQTDIHEAIREARAAAQDDEALDEAATREALDLPAARA